MLGLDNAGMLAGGRVLHSTCHGVTVVVDGPDMQPGKDVERCSFFSFGESPCVGAPAALARRSGLSCIVHVETSHGPTIVLVLFLATGANVFAFGESRVQEARAKIPELPSALRWHFVGHLQKNKIRHALPLFELFHSVDSLALAEDINRIADEAGLHPRVLLEVNVSGEGSKFGFSPDKLREAIEAMVALPRLTIEGLMTIPPLAPEAEGSRKFFAQLRDLAGQTTAGLWRWASSSLDGDD